MAVTSAGAPPGTEKATVDVLVLIDHLVLGGAQMLLGQFAAAAPGAGIRLQVAQIEDGDDSPAVAPLREAGVNPVSLHLHGRPSARHVRAVRSHIQSTRPDIVHTHLGTADLIGGLAARSLGVPSVATIHEIKQPHSGLAWAKDAAYTFTQRCCAARVIVVSDSARRAYLRETRGMQDRVVRIYNGIDFPPAPGSGAAVRAELGLAPQDLVVGMVSALRPEKGHDIALRAVSLLREQFPRLRLLIAGQGGSAEEIARLAAPLGESVVFAGRRTDVASVFDSLDVCLHPSRMDAFPTTLIEALAASVPVLATAVGGIPEIIDDGVSGVLVPAPPSPEALAQALGGLLADPERRNELAAAGRTAYEERFTAGPWAHHTRDLYDEVLAERRSASTPQLHRRSG